LRGFVGDFTADWTQRVLIFDLADPYFVEQPQRVHVLDEEVDCGQHVHLQRNGFLGQHDSLGDQRQPCASEALVHIHFLEQRQPNQHWVAAHQRVVESLDGLNVVALHNQLFGRVGENDWNRLLQLRTEAVGLALADGLLEVGYHPQVGCEYGGQVGGVCRKQNHHEHPHPCRQNHLRLHLVVVHVLVAHAPAETCDHVVETVEKGNVVDFGVDPRDQHEEEEYAAPERVVEGDEYFDQGLQLLVPGGLRDHHDVVDVGGQRVAVVEHAGLAEELLPQADVDHVVVQLVQAALELGVRLVQPRVSQLRNDVDGHTALNHCEASISRNLVERVHQDASPVAVLVLEHILAERQVTHPNVFPFEWSRRVFDVHAFIDILCLYFHLVRTKASVNTG